MRHQDSVWLERRPPRGLWGGLLAPPSFADAQALATHLRDAGLAPLVATRWLPARSHAFTHFSLQFTVCLAEFSAAPTARCRPLGEPIDASAWEALALPAPVARLLSDLVTGKA
jgi:A/G-specific adenine glycosylase